MTTIYGRVTLENGLTIDWQRKAASAEDAVRVVTAQHVHVVRCWSLTAEDVARELVEKAGREQRADVRPLDAAILANAMKLCGMTVLPPPLSEDGSDRAAGDCLCDRCGHEFREHPEDWRVIGYGDRPFLNILCNGRRVKL